MDKHYSQVFDVGFQSSKKLIEKCIMTCENTFQKLHSLESFTMCHLLMLTQDSYGFILSHTSLSCLQLSKVGNPKERRWKNIQNLSTKFGKKYTFQKI